MKFYVTEETKTFIAEHFGELDYEIVEEYNYDSNSLGCFKHKYLDKVFINVAKIPNLLTYQYVLVHELTHLYQVNYDSMFSVLKKDVASEFLKLTYRMKVDYHNKPQECDAELAAYYYLWSLKDMEDDAKFHYIRRFIEPKCNATMRGLVKAMNVANEKYRNEEDIDVFEQAFVDKIESIMDELDRSQFNTAC